MSLKFRLRSADEDTVPVTLVESEGLCLVRLEGEINIASAAELKKCLLEGLAGGKELRLDLEGASELDVTILQLLWAAERAAAASGGRFTVQGRIPEEIAVATGDGGFKKFPVFGMFSAGDGSRTGANTETVCESGLET